MGPNSLMVVYVDPLAGFSLGCSAYGIGFRGEVLLLGFKV